MTTSNPSQLSKILESLQLDKLGESTGFYIRQPRKITIEFLLVSFFQMLVDGRFSLRQWASNISTLNGSLTSFQAVAKKLDFRQETFFQALFQKALLNRLQQKLNFEIHDILKPFKRVLIEDSTCFKLSNALFDFFPGPRLPHGRKAGGRLQLRIDLKAHRYEAIALRSYCQNDQTYAHDILTSLEKNELVIRDLGYWSIPVFEKIIKKEAYFLSRLNLGVNVLCPVTQQRIDLVSFLKRQERQGIHQLDMPILLGENYRLPIRLIAIKLTNEQAQKRRRMAKAQRHKNSTITEDAIYLQSWNLFITNVNNSIWDIASVYHAYSLRWHIEIVFKCWKSKFHFTSFFKHCNGRNPVKPEIILLLILIWIVLYFMPKFNSYANAVWKKYRRILSPLRFADFIHSHPQIYASQTESNFIAILAYYSCYDKRKDRVNHFEKTYMNFLS